MSQPLLYSIIESPTHPDFAPLCQRLGLEVFSFKSMRKAISQLKGRAPDIVVCEFFYGYGNNYAGVNISNLDVFLFSLQKYAPQAQVIVMVEPAERHYVDKLNEILPLHEVLKHPVDKPRMEALLRSLI